ncbi:MAG: hypothetical protein R3E58_19010 [Phycisphaerae bacterium]
MPTAAFEILDAPLDAFSVSVYANGYTPLLDQVIAADRVGVHV